MSRASQLASVSSQSEFHLLDFIYPLTHFFSNSELCNECFYCRRGQLLLCEHFEAHGVTMDGGFAEFCAYPAGKVFKIHNLSDVDATLLEPASCAAHGLDKIAPKLGSSVLMFGAGPTGLVLAQMLRQNGGCNVVVAAPQGLKMDLAKKLGAGDVCTLAPFRLKSY